VNLSNGLDTTSYFRGDGRFRDLAISPDGLKIYVACDASGQTSGPTGGFNGGGTPPPHAGTILEYSYTGIILPVREPDIVVLNKEKAIKIYPNPAGETMNVSVTVNAQKPYIITVYTATGTLVNTVKTTKSESTLSIADLKPGMYFVQVSNAFGQLLKTDKIIKL